MRVALADLLESDHDELDGLLHSTFASIESADAARAFHDLDLFWARLAIHIRAEHIRLFPAVREIAAYLSQPNEICDLLDELRHDHDFFMRELARAVKAMRLVFDFGNEAETFVVVREMLLGVKERLNRHNRIEETKIYPLVSSPLMTPEQVERLQAEVTKELANIPPRFRNA
ncbi:MAG: hemerythrin domain-containing protein [Pyrinomonadaceae bacterium]